MRDLEEYDLHIWCRMYHMTLEELRQNSSLYSPTHYYKDTSACITNEQIREFLDEINHILSATKEE